MTNQELSLVSMDELWDEIRRRHEAAVLIAMNTLDKHSEASQVSFSGGKFACLGLIEKAKIYVLNQMIIEENSPGGFIP